jgi:hypothetical protein
MGCINKKKGDLYEAIADPTKREIIRPKSFHSLNVNTEAGKFRVCRAAIYNHIKIICLCGRIDVKQQSRERFVNADLQNTRKYQSKKNCNVDSSW